MSYRFMNASIGIQKTPKQTFWEDFQENLNVEFYNSSDWWTIKEEYPCGSGEYIDIDVRVNRAIGTRTGNNQGDDYKIILFKNLDHVANLGNLYYFDNNYWIVINSEGIKSLAASVTVRRCNNTLRWLDHKTGKIYSSPCSIDYLIQQNRDYSTAGSSLVVPSGTIEVVTQFNETTNRIMPSQRFLFGNKDNWQGFKIMGGGLNNFNRLQTEDGNSSGIIRITMSAAQKGDNEIDDIVNGIADVKEYLYALSLNYNSLSLENGKQATIIPSLTLNGATYDDSFVWETSNSLVATVSNGIVTAISNGVCNIKCSSIFNSDIFETCVVTVSSSITDNYEIRIDPNINYILEGETQVFNVQLYKNALIEAESFVFELNEPNLVPAGNFDFAVVDGNNFSIKNISKYLDNSLAVKCTSLYGELIVYIDLKGVW